MFICEGTLYILQCDVIDFILVNLLLNQASMVGQIRMTGDKTLGYVTLLREH